ncbi:hypothetical protein WA026_019552 [Henosepilachna vigintioctopunctata]|uniref:Uncharacterized protein n=1 Tax=Henosepilachna vigintioctopunctata TaxID=420089 RepID=A0AAW1TQZ8_9CUCU
MFLSFHFEYIFIGKTSKKSFNLCMCQKLEGISRKSEKNMLVISKEKLQTSLNDFRIPKTSIIEMEVPQKTSIKIHIFLSYNDIPSTLVTTYEKIYIMVLLISFNMKIF